MSPSIPQPIRNAHVDDSAVQRVSETDSVPRQKVLNLAEAAALVRCSRAHLSNIVNGKVHGIPRICWGSAGVAYFVDVQGLRRREADATNG